MKIFKLPAQVNDGKAFMIKKREFFFPLETLLQ